MADSNLCQEIAAAGREVGLDLDPKLVAFTVGYIAALKDGTALSDSSKGSLLVENIQQMNRLAGYDVVIVCCSNQSQEDYWQNRLESVRGQVMPLNTVILAVHEDWPGGAGNGLGTLYAYQKAVAKAKEGGLDLNEMLSSNASLALFHTAGKGTRLAPLPGSESNNKPAVKLPGVVDIDGKSLPLTILEGVIKQTGVYAACRKGRLSVYWGDQIFVPSKSCIYQATAHVDILAMLGDWPTKDEWIAKGLDQFGLIAVNKEGAAAQVEKVDYDTAEKLLANLGEMASVGTSLGSFSVDHNILQALLKEFAPELAEKQGKLDTDPHFWMPMTLPRDGYVRLMGQKGVDASKAAGHWDRVENMVTKFRETTGSKAPMFGAVDVGSNPYWWDYGQIKYFFDNNSKILRSDLEAVAMRLFFGVDEGSVHDGVVSLASTVGGGTQKNSLLVNCNIGTANVENSILINVSAKSVSGKGVILYNIADEGDVSLEEGAVITDVAMPTEGKIVRMNSTVGTNGGKAWNERVHGSPYSAAEVHKLHQSTDVEAAFKMIQARLAECAP